MQTLLQKVFNLTILLLAIKLWTGSAISIAQISVSEIQPLEIRFTLENSQRTHQTAALNLSEWHDITVEEFRPIQNQWFLFDSESPAEGNLYIAESQRFLSPGRVKSSGNEKAYFTASLQNNSDESIGGLLAAFDFVYNRNLIQHDETLSLLYRVNNGAWRNAEGGIFRTGQLPEGEEEWKSFSVQMNIDNIYIRPGDLLHLMWVSNDEIRDESDSPVFLQRIEIFPETSRLQKMERGSLIITEIMPTTEVDGTLFEYIELYNPDNKSVSLKGVEINTPRGNYVIQHEVSVPPYGLFVLSNMDISSLEGVSNSYYYSDNLFPETGGRIELIHQNDMIASATYEAGEKGVALQLDRISNAFDGYTSLTNLVPADESFFPDLSGTPGQFGRTIPVYRKSIEKEGWHFISPPGRLNSRLNRHNTLTFYTLEGEEISPEMAEPFAPLFLYKSGQEVITLHAEAVPVTDVSHSLVQVSVDSGTFLTANSWPTQVSIAQLLRSSELSVPPFVSVWNEQAGLFQLTRTDDTSLLDWTPFILPYNLNRRVSSSQAGTGYAADISRRITFSLFEGEGNQKRLVDNAILGFLQLPTGSESTRYDLAKIQTEFNRRGERTSAGQSFLYLASPESGAAVNSFVHLPYDIQEEYSVGLGYEFSPYQSAGNATIEWSLPSDFPDEWVLSLRDIRSGTTVDMREESSYRFRYSVNQPEEQPAEDVIKLGTLQPNERNRFMIEMKPHETIAEEEEEEETRPGNVELRQNYPNPFNPATNITFYLPEERAVKVGIYNIVGQQVAILLDENMQAGEHSVIWDASNNPSGIYIVQLETGSRIFTRKITLIK